MNDTTNRRILLVDDTPEIHEDFKKILGTDEAVDQEMDAAKAAFFGTAETETKTTGFLLESAFQGQEALEMIIESRKNGAPFAMAFVDIRMPPGWDGVETVSRLFQTDPDIQVVICTAYSDYSWDEMIERIGQSDRLLILKKPFDPVEICQLATALTNKWNVAKEGKLLLENLRGAEQEALNQAESLRMTNAQLENARATADRSSKMKTDFLVHLSKEFHTNLHSILGQAAHLQDPGKPAPSQFDLLEVILGTSHHLINSLDQMMDLTMVESGRMRMNPCELTTAPFVEDIVEGKREEAREQNVTLESKCTNVPDTFRADAKRLKQVLNLLVDRAIRHSAGGTVSVVAAMERNELWTQPALRFHVTDTNSSIRQADFVNLFEPFFHPEGEASGGTGLELALAQRLAQMVGADVTVASEAGSETTFTVTMAERVATKLAP